MSRSDDNDGQTAADRLIYEAREHLQAVRNQFWRERIRGAPSRQVRRELAIAALQLYDVLYEHREDQVVKTDWEESAATELQQLLDETVQVRREAAGDTANGQTVARPAIMAVSPDRLLEITKELDDLAKKLGFSAATADGTARTEITEEMIEDVEKWRKANL
jgi:hypothetical protein